MVLLPSLVFRAQVKGDRVLKVHWENNGFVTGLARHLDSKIPSVEGDERPFGTVLSIARLEVMVVEGVETMYCGLEVAGVAHLIPRQGSKTSCNFMTLVNDASIRGRATYCIEV